MTNDEEQQRELEEQGREAAGFWASDPDVPGGLLCRKCGATLSILESVDHAAKHLPPVEDQPTRR